MNKDPIRYFDLGKISNDKLYTSILKALQDLLIKNNKDIYTNKLSTYDYLFYKLVNGKKTLIYTDLYHKFIEQLIKNTGNSEKNKKQNELFKMYITIAKKYYINNYIPIDYKSDAYKIFSKEWSELSSSPQQLQVLRK